jgi:hypothetical protein
MPLNAREVTELKSLWAECLEAVRLQQPPEASAERFARIDALRERLEGYDPGTE